MAEEWCEEDEDLACPWGEESTDAGVAGAEEDGEDLAAGCGEWAEAPDVDEAGAGEVDDGWEAVADGEGDCALAVADGEGDACDGAWAAEGEGDAWEEGVVEGAEAEGAEEGLAWDGDEAEAAALDVAYECLNAENQEDGAPEAELLARLRQGFSTRLFPGRRFHLEPFGSYITDLGLPNSDGSGRSDLDVVLLFQGFRSDSFENREVRRDLVSPTIDQLAAYLRREPGLVLKNVVPKARVPIVTFETEQLSVDISVQQPYGVLNSWHLRDLCLSGWPGRLRALSRLVKLWAKSKAIHTAKDGALSSYGYVMLATSFLQECGGVPALRVNRASGPYIDADAALRHVLDACSRTGGAAGQSALPRPGGLWRAPERIEPSSSAAEQAMAKPVELFSAWLSWMAETVLAFLGDASGAVGKTPLQDRYIVSVRGRTQEELRADVTWSGKRAEHWCPEASDVFMLIEEPLNGENVARCVRNEGLWAIYKEVCRARDFFASAPLDEEGLPPFKALLKLRPLSTRQQPPVSLGAHAAAMRCFSCGQAGHALRDCPRQRAQGAMPQGAPQGQKRPLPACGAPQPPLKRPALSAFGAQARARAQHAAAAAGRPPPLWNGVPAMGAYPMGAAQRPRPMHVMPGRPQYYPRPAAGVVQPRQAWGRPPAGPGARRPGW